MTFNPNQPYNDLPPLPPKADLETPAILKAAIAANRSLAELKGFVNVIPNPQLLIQMLVVQEAKDSSEIENIITTRDELYRALSIESSNVSKETKEVLRYREALWDGYSVLKSKGIMNINSLLNIRQILIGTDEGIRKIPGTTLTNDKTGETVYTPPVGQDLIREKLSNLEKYMHTENGIDDLVRMSVIHYQFEAIHPFSDGNGRTGRILNVLYLVHKGLLDLPVLYISSYIIQNKSRYYELLRGVTETGDWENWIIYILNAVDKTSQETISRISQLRDTFNEVLDEVKTALPQVYSKELIELLFKRPYCKVGFITDEGIVKRQTAASYLKSLEELGILESVQIGREVLYLNKRLIGVFSGGE